MANVDNNYLIEGHFEGTLDESEQALFEDKLANDPEFAQEVKDYELLESGLAGLGLENFTQEISDWEDTFQANRKSSSTAKVIKFASPRSYATIAAVIALLIGLTYIVPYLNQPSGQNADAFFEEYYEPYEDMIIVRGDSSTESTKFLQSAMEAYNAGNYQLSVDLLERYVSESDNDLRPYLYIGISQMELGQFDLAETSFNKAMELPAYKEQSQWYQMLSFLKSGKESKALTLLNEIRDTNPNHYRSQEMEKLVKVLE